MGGGEERRGGERGEERVEADLSVQIDWGTYPLGFDQLDVFLDTHCKVKLRTIQKGHSGDSCVDTKGFWGSVKYSDVKVGHE